jgi:hypothetical protein
MNPINRLHTHAMFIQTPQNSFKERMSHITSIHSIISKSEISNDIPSNIANQFISTRPWFLREVLTLCLTPDGIEHKAYIGFTNFINTFMDKGVLIKQSFFLKNDFEKWSQLLKEYLLCNENKFNTDMEQNEKKQFMMIWEVYADLHPNDERILLINA